MKVLHVNGAKAYGGNEQQILDICNKLSEMGVENGVYCAGDSELQSRLTVYPKIRVYPCQFDKFNSRPSRQQFLKAIEGFNPDLLHIHNNNGLSLYFFTALFHKIQPKIIYSKKGMGSSMSFLSKFKYNYKGIDKIICVSRITEASMKDQVMFTKNHDKLCVIPDGIDLDRPISLTGESLILKQNNRKVQIGNIANHNASKDLENLIKTVHHLVYELNFSDFILHQIGGYSKITEKLKQLASTLKVNEFIKFYGFLDEAIKCYGEFDIFVMSSQREGGPSSVLEAMRFKIPVVSTKVGLIPTAIINGETGYSVPVKDHVALAEKLHQLCLNSELRKTFGENGYNHFLCNFTAQKTAGKTLELYRDVLKL